MTDTALTPLRLLRRVHHRGQLLPLLREATVEQAALRAAGELGLAPSAAELQSAADAFRRHRGLTSAAQTRAWLAAEQLTPADLEAAVECDLLDEKFKDHLLARDGAARFAADPGRYARARLRVLVAASEGEARERAAQVREEGADFAELARRYSLDTASRPAGGDLGEVFRARLPAAVANAVFAARPGDVVGPFTGEHGFYLFHVGEVLPPDPASAAPLLRAEVFADWAREQLAVAPIDLSWLEPSDDAG